MIAEPMAVTLDETDDDLDDRRGKTDAAYRTISEVATDLNLPQHVLRFWESKFKQISPLKRGGGRRYYRPQDTDLIKRIHYLLYTQGYTIKGVQKLLSKDRQLLQSVPDLSTGNPRVVVAEVTALRAEHTINAANTQEQPNLFSQSGDLSAVQKNDLQLLLSKMKQLRQILSARC